MEAATATASATARAAAARLAQLQFQDWSTSVYVLVLAALATLLLGSAAASSAWRRPSFPKTAPRLLGGGGGWPVFGMLRFFSDRRNFCSAAAHESASGNYSFYFGRHQIVGVSGVAGRKTFFESKDLNMTEGYAVLFTTTPQVNGPANAPGEASGFSKWFIKNLTAMMRRENFERLLPQLVADSRARLESVVARHGPTGEFDPFDDVYRIVYQLTMRTVGADDIAESPALLERTLRLFEVVEAASSPARIIFPWLPTPAHLRRMYAGARLYMIFNGIAQERQKTGRRGEDALQFLLDGGGDIVKILSFVLGALFAGQLNSGINAAWLFVYLACDAEWYARVQGEVDAAVARHRTSPSQSPADVLATLPIDAWESEFPLIDLCLRECIRLQLVGTAFRKNISGRDLTIGSSGSSAEKAEIIPRDAFAVYLIDDVHMNPAIYPNPERFDPGRYLPDRAEDKAQPNAYVGWGTGRHPCLGMRFAKLEMALIGAMVVSMFDYELVDGRTGEKMSAAPPTNRDNHAASKPDFPLRLRYTLRQH